MNIKLLICKKLEVGISEGKQTKHMHVQSYTNTQKDIAYIYIYKFEDTYHTNTQTNTLIILTHLQ